MIYGIKYIYNIITFVIYLIYKYSELCKEYGWSVTVRIRLTSAIKSTPGSTASQTPQIVFLGDKEKDILDKLYQKTEQILYDMNNI